MICPSCEYPNFKIVPKCANCDFDFKKFKGEAPSSLAKVGFTVFAGTPAVALAEAEPEAAVASEESSPDGDLATADSEVDTKDFNDVAVEPDLELPEAEEVTLDLGGEEVELPPVTEELALSPELDEEISLDLSEDTPGETAVETDIEFELEGDDSPTVEEEADTSAPEIEDLGLKIEPSDDLEPPAQ
ncbi:MAG: hypothetical protein QF434_05035 [Nitrospinaceae bacterium]|nr:hypothetical protein [Nitrospinaceae bacterium]